jgi:Na+-transporting methylmalonyl-CoA/oxaloacetate decarboxylase gamma subunit
METASQAVNLHEQIQGVGGASILTIIAFTIVFLVLGGLTAIIYGIKYMAAGLERKEKGGGGGVVGRPVPASPGSAPSSGGAPDGRLLAVIAGAVAAHAGGKYAVSSVRPLGAALSPRGGEAWKQAAIYQSMGGLSRGWK